MEGFSVESALQKFMDRKFKDGDLISHLAFDDLLQCNHEARGKDEAFIRLTRFESLKNKLLENNILLENVRGEGYRIVPQAAHARFAIKKAMKKIKSATDTAKEEIKHTDMKKLTREEQHEHQDLSHRLDQFADDVEYNRLDHFAACKKLLGYSH